MSSRRKVGCMVFENNDFLVINKPYGYRVHRVNPMQWGLLETLESQKNCKLWPVHRLDKDTSGLLIFAKSKETSQNFFDLFEQNKVHKKYLFLTSKKSMQESFEYESFIEKLDETFTSSKTQPPNSKTRFKKMQAVGPLTLWLAEPETGKPHQIRLHARDNNMTVLGDPLYHGGPHHRLALHAAELEFSFKNEKFHFTCPAPSDFTPLSNGTEALLLSAKENIYNWINHQDTNCLQIARLMRNQWAIELLDQTYWIKNYGEPLTDVVKNELQHFATKHSCKVFVRTMKDRGQGVGGEEKDLLFATDSRTTTWTVKENDLNYELRSDSGFSTGLFLDQRENRLWVKNNSIGKRVLNLFSYTCAFSVSAAAGDAETVTSVDASGVFLDWGKQNFLLNDLDPAAAEFFQQDCLLFLNGAKKRSRKWDLIVCDPPTFGRSKNNIWKIEKDFPELMQLLWSCLEKRGRILLTCNYEKWTKTDLIKKIRLALKNDRVEILDLPLPPLDYGCYDELELGTKGVYIVKP